MKSKVDQIFSLGDKVVFTPYNKNWRRFYNADGVGPGDKGVVTLSEGTDIRVSFTRTDGSVCHEFWTEPKDITKEESRGG